jgi:hypothetical protein
MEINTQENGKIIIKYVYYRPKSPYNMLPHTNRAGAAPCTLFQHICTQIVHEGYSSMEQGKAIHGPVEVGIELREGKLKPTTSL